LKEREKRNTEPSPPPHRNIDRDRRPVSL
jgi:hypothetical protein